VQVAAYCALLERTLGEGPCDIDCRIEASVLTQDHATTQAQSPFDLPTFRRGEWELYAERLLASDGPVDEALEADLTDLSFSLDQVCDNCAYREACTTRAVEDPTAQASLAVLGLDANVQQRLEQADITSLRELSEVHERLDNPQPTDDPPTLDLDPEIRRALEEALPGPVHETVQRAQALRGELDPEYPTTPRPQPIPGKDWIPLPDDRGDGWGNLDSANKGELVHVALFVRPETTIDRIATLGACVYADAHDEYLTVGEVIDAVPDDPAVAQDAERQLFEEFTTELFDAIEHVATGIGTPEQTAMHCYTYSTQEKQALAEGLDRHTDQLQRARALRNLLSLHADGHTELDQKLCSAVQPILHEHFALQYPAQGLLTVADQFIPGWTLEAFDPLDARGDEPPLRAIFREQFLNYRVPYLAGNTGVHLHLARGPLGEGPAADAAGVDADRPSEDGWYPVRRRAGGQFPIEYIWACTPQHPSDETPRLTPDSVDSWAVDAENEPLYRQEIDKFYTRIAGDDEPLQQADVEYLVERLSYALCRLVTAIPYKNQYQDKAFLDATSLNSVTLPVNSLPTAGRDYLRMEHGAQKEEIHSLYRQSLRDRARTGRSIPIRCTEYEIDDDGFLTLTGELAYDAVFDDSETAEAVRRQCRVRPGTGSGSGNWRLLTRLTGDAAPPSPSARGRVTTTVDKPAAVQYSPPVLIEGLDQQAGTITLTAFAHRFRQHGSEFRVDHCGWVCPEGSNLTDPAAPPANRDGYVADRPPVQVDTGELFVLDPMVDDLGAPKADRALKPDTVQANVLWQHLQADTPNARPAQPGQSTEITRFLAACDVHDEVISPNADQRQFVETLDSPVVALQGPPGAGKTSGATAPALLARAFAQAAHDESFVGFVVAPSHEAVDATLAGVSDLLADWRAATDGLETLTLVRVLPSPPPAPEERVGTGTDDVPVEYCNYHAADADQQMRRAAAPLFDDESTKQCLVFATPATLYHVLGMVAEHCDAIDGTSAPAAMRYAPGLADVVCIDEASMCDIPRLFLASSAVKPTGQTLLVGDHRQLPTITQYDWANTLRKPLEQTQAYRSALTYVQQRHDTHSTVAPPQATQPDSSERGTGATQSTTPNNHESNESEDQ
jgi:hypothetical protein